MSQFGWKPLSVVPSVPDGQFFQAIGAWKSDSEKWYVGEVYYLNSVQLEDLDGGDEEYFDCTGWHILKEDDGCERYESIDILFWQEMPAPPKEHPASPRGTEQSDTSPDGSQEGTGGPR